MYAKKDKKYFVVLFIKSRPSKRFGLFSDSGFLFILEKLNEKITVFSQGTY